MARSVMLKVLLPALLGSAAAYAFRSHHSPAPPATPVGAQEVAAGTPPLQRRIPTSRPLSADPEIIRIVTMAGRPEEARARLTAVLKEGGSDKDAAKWLAPLLISSPEWLDEFLPGVPEERRRKLMAATFIELTKIQPDSVWELVRRSKAALALVKEEVPGDISSGLGIVRAAIESPLLAEVLFDPTLEFSNSQIERFLSHGSENPPAMKALLEAWISGRWQGRNPPCMRQAWLWLGRLDPEALNVIRQSIPEESALAARKFDAYLSIRQGGPETPEMEALLTLGAEEIMDYSEGRNQDGQHLPIATVAALPTDLRSAVLQTYIKSFHPLDNGALASAVAQLEQTTLSTAEKDQLLSDAVQMDWQNQGNIRSAMDWISRMTPGGKQDALYREVFESYAGDDPEGAAEYAETLPAGKLRDELRKAANDAK